MRPEHTKGPWTYGHLGQHALWIGPSHDQRPVAIVEHDTDDARPESRANARVLAASDDLLAALERLLGTPEDPNMGWRGQGTTELFACEFCGAKHIDCSSIEHGISCPIPQARAALAKAQGAQQ